MEHRTSGWSSGRHWDEEKGPGFRRAWHLELIQKCESIEEAELLWTRILRMRQWFGMSGRPSFAVEMVGTAVIVTLTYSKEQIELLFDFDDTPTLVNTILTAFMDRLGNV